MFCFSLPEKYLWNVDETSMDFASISSHFVFAKVIEESREILAIS
jgi:hypothetical protein